MNHAYCFILIVSISKNIQSVNRKSNTFLPVGSSKKRKPNCAVVPAFVF